jgi:hypothetical protein
MKTRIAIQENGELCVMPYSSSDRAEFAWYTKDLGRFERLLKYKKVKITGNLPEYPIIAEYIESTDEIYICTEFYTITDVSTTKIEFI